MADKQLVLSISLALTTALLTLTSSQPENSFKSTTADADTRCQLTLNGLVDYYWKSDPAHKQVEFLFSCGQLGGAGTSTPAECSCVHPTSCTNCYRWWTGVMMESVATYGIYMNTTNHSTLPEVVYSHSPYNDKWDAVKTCTYVDDFLWYGIAYLRVYDWLSVSSR